MCPRCKQDKPLTEHLYKTGRGTSAPCCQSCADAIAKRRQEMKAWRAKNKEKHCAWSKRWYENNKEKALARQLEYNKGDKHRTWHNAYRRGRKEIRAKEAREYRAKRRDFVLAYRRAHYATNREALKAYQSQYKRAHPWINRVGSSKRRCSKLQRTPPWLNKKLLNVVYKDCPKGMVVDHIIPLRGKTVSGLHVPWNLQYLTDAENATKNNKFDPIAYAAQYPILEDSAKVEPNGADPQTHSVHGLQCSGAHDSAVEQGADQVVSCAVESTA